jgi:hypothetical protein
MKRSQDHEDDSWEVPKCARQVSNKIWRLEDGRDSYTYEGKRSMKKLLWIVHFAEVFLTRASMDLLT